MVFGVVVARVSAVLPMKRKKKVSLCRVLCVRACVCCIILCVTELVDCLCAIFVRCRFNRCARSVDSVVLRNASLSLSFPLFFVVHCVVSRC